MYIIRSYNINNTKTSKMIKLINQSTSKIHISRSNIVRKYVQLFFAIIRKVKFLNH